jgi:predicted nucleic acid-binding Zn ribbon protein
MTSIRQLVEQYTTLGLVVIPVSGKRPVSVVLDEYGQPLRRPDGSLVRWQPFVERPPSDAEFQAFEWQRATGLAVVVGPATWLAWPYLWCLDIEHESRSEGEQWLDQHVPGWRDGVVVETGGGGLHVYFLASHPVTTGVIRWGEARGRGALCVLPPSKHPETGRAYRWLSERWTNLPQLEPTSVPAYGRSAENGHQVERLDVGRVLEGVPLGQRNQTLFRLACRLRAAGVPAEWTTRLVAEVASRCTPPWGSGPDEESPERLVERVYRRYQPNPELVVVNGKHEFDSPHIEEDRGEKNSNSIPDSWLPVPISELGTDTVGVEWLWDGFLARGHVTDFIGLWKSGKTTFVAALLRLMASGGELAGQPVRPGKALVVTEEPRGKWLERREALALGDHVHIISRPFPKRPNHAEWLAFTSHITRLVTEHGYDLVVFDSLPNLWCVHDENDAAEVISALLPLQGVATAGCAVLLVRHPRKSDGGQATAGRGSGAIAGFVDIIIEMRRYEPEQLQDTRRVLSVYSRYDCFETLIRWNGGDFEALGSPVAYSAEAQREQLVAVLVELGTATTGELAKAVELPHSTASKRLSELEAAGRVIRTGSGKRGDPYRWSLADGGDDPDGDDFVSPTKAPIVGEKKSDGETKNPHQNCEKALHTPADHTGGSGDGPENPHQNCEKALHTCVVCGQAIPQVSGQATRYCSTACRVKAYRQRQSSAGTPGHGESEPNGRHSPGDSSQPVEQGAPDDIIAWGEWLLGELRAGRVQLPVIELKPGHTVLVPERFLASHLNEAKLGFSAALENLWLLRRVLEAVSGQRRGKE